MRCSNSALALGILAVLGACTGRIGAGDDPAVTPPPGARADAGVTDPTTPDAGASPETCVPTQTFWEERAWPEVFATRCIACHVVGGQAERTRLVLRRDDPEATRRAVGQVARAEVEGRPLLLVKPLGGAMHGGGAIVADGSPEQAVLAELVDRARSPRACDDDVFGTTLCETPRVESGKVRLLTRVELHHTVRAALVPTSTGALSRWPSDAKVNGFESASDFLIADAQRVDGLLSLAADLTPAVVSAMGCGGAPDAACLRTFLVARLPALWRRDAAAADLDALVGLFEAALADGGTPSEGVEVALAAALSAPEALYRRESSGRLDPRETGELLAFTLTGAPPDGALRAAIADGSIARAEVRGQHAARLLDTPLGRERLIDFVWQWLELDRIQGTQKSASVYPSFDATLRDAMERELRLFVEHALFGGGGDLTALLTSTDGFVDAPLAALYGVAVPTTTVVHDGLRQVALPERKGILTRAGVLAAFANPIGSSPVKRGLLVRNRLLCQDIPPPPPDASTTPPSEVMGQPIRTTRDRYQVHITDARCASCHTQLDPLGFAFERFDGIGQRREREGGVAVDPSGAVSGTAFTALTFADEAELLEALATSKDVQRCLAHSYAMHVFGSARAFSDGCVDARIAEIVESRGGSLVELARALPTLDAFVERR